MPAFILQASFTRPNNVTAYTANDVVGPTAAALTMNSSGSSVGSSGLVRITSSMLLQYSAFVSGETTFNLHLYQVTPPSALADNAAFDLPSGDRSSYIGFIPLGTMAAVGTSSAAAISNNIQCYLSPSGFNPLFAYLQTVGAWTPAANTIFTLKLNGETVE